ncbi:MAG TPA: trypsin-like peptidase domain-containing protein [bacterium]|nr:trypsin-like peptidase domain-containing protein [bacterium]
MMTVLRQHRWIFLMLVVVLVLPVPVRAQQGPLSPESVDAVDRAIVLVHTYRESGGRTSRGSGSGIIIDSTGLILTADHVAARSTRLEVVLQNGEVYPATVVGTDPLFDSALVRIQTNRSLPSAFLGASTGLAPGDSVMAFGRAPRRQSGPTGGTFLAFDVDARPGVLNLRSSAVAWPGDSGGALVNGRGEVVGVIVAITRDGNISLSVSIDAIKHIMNDLRLGFVRHPWLGLTGTTISEQIAQEHGLTVRQGVLVFEVFEGGPAAQAGLRAGRATGAGNVPQGGDVIVAIDGRSTVTFGQMAAYILSKRIGDAIRLDMLRDGQPLGATVILAERPSL